MRFGPFQVDQQRQEVTKNGLRLKLQGKMYQVQLSASGKTARRQFCFRYCYSVWGLLNNTHVNYDANVNTTGEK